MRQQPTMSPDTHLVTADDLMRMPDDGYSYELVQGRLIKMSHPSPRHGLVGTRLGLALYQFVEEHKLGVAFANEVGFKLFCPGTAPVTLTRGDELDGGDVVPGFRFRVSRLFE